MESLESIFGSCVLQVFTSDTSISFPEDDLLVDDWLASLKQPRAERKQAFFDEQLNLFLVVYINQPYSDHDHHPPRSLVDFLGHVQVSLEATYISQTPSQDSPDTVTPVPPRTSSMAKSRPSSLHPSIFPPHTPNPIPSTTENDRKYVQSEGTLLYSGIWGMKKATDESSREKFTLVFSETQGIWIAVYELSLIVSYLRLAFADPLLCLTASATLRDKALSLTQSTHPLVAYLTRAGLISDLELGTVAGGENDEEDEENGDTGFEEINLLDGLTLVGSRMPSDSESLYLPSTRLGNDTRRRLFALPPLSAPIQTPPPTSKQTFVMRKSYRKILQTVSGFRVRMRTVLVPHVLLPKNPDHGRNDFESGNEEREAGNSERTVVLCVEVENSGESGPTMGFLLERLDVKIGGEGATTRLIGWGECAFDSKIEDRLFPLRIGSMEQYNLLYVVSFWSTPHDQENLWSAGRGPDSGGELQRTVTIVIYGRPYLTSGIEDENAILSYPTQTFSSRWNCILDLSSRSREELVDLHEPTGGRSALPEPPSPFPGRTAFSFSSPLSSRVSTPTPHAIAGKRHTLPGSITAMRAVNPSSNFRLSLPSRDQPGGSAMSPSLSTAAFTPPSVALQAFTRSIPTPYGITPPPPSGLNVHVPVLPPEVPTQAFITPPTPAYPAFSPAMPTHTPHVQALGSQQGYSGPSIEIKRERGTGMSAAVPQTPLPTVLSTQFGVRQDSVPVPSDEPIVVSVGLLPAADAGEGDQREIYPSDTFTLDIFVYNQSSWTRRFEISYPIAGRRPRQGEQNKGSKGKGSSMAAPGILPLQNRVRVGPLRSYTCQSVRMDFLAISPGVHSVDVLTLTDVETGYAVKLRSVMDIVVHERAGEEKEDKVP